MKKVLAFLLLMIVFYSCEEDKKTVYTILSGQIENPNSETISIYSERDLVSEIPIAEDGTFRDSLQLESGYYSLSHGRERSTIYLEGDFDLIISLNPEKFDESISYEGKGADVNNFLAQKYLYKEEAIGSSKTHFSLDENEYKQKLTDIKAGLMEKLQSSINSDSKFYELEQLNLDYEFVDALMKYESYHAYYAEKPKFEVSSDFIPERVRSMTFDDQKLYNAIPSYRTLSRNILSSEIEDAIGEDFQIAQASDFKALTECKIPELKNSFIGGTGRYLMSPANPNMTEIYKLFMEHLTDEEIKGSLKSKFEKNKELLPGMPSPVFLNYENHDGGTTSLEDLQGKYVYVDVWATWCAPCIREVPYLKEVEESYEGRNIAFVSTSIDVAADHNKWVDMVTDKELGGIQLFADNDWNSAFVKDYGIEGIPRFILIDPEGKIVSADAPRPSNEKLRQMFDELKL